MITDDQSAAMDDRTFQRRIATYVWCAEHYNGATSREYRLMSRFARAGIRVSDRAWDEINGSADVDPDEAEWFEGRERYLQLCASMKPGCDCLSR